MAFITKPQAEQYLREYYEDNYGTYDEDASTYVFDESFEDVVEALEDQLDLVSPELAYAWHVFNRG